MKLGAVIIPATTLLGTADLVDRVERGEAQPRGRRLPTARTSSTHVPGDYTADRGRRRPSTAGCATTRRRGAPASFRPDGVTTASDRCCSTSRPAPPRKPKLVEHTHRRYPVGHLSTMYWIGLRPGDVHLNISSPGWAKHAWSCFFAPWNAEATVFIYNYARFDAARAARPRARCGVTTFCAPPTVWRMLIQEDLAALRIRAARGGRRRRAAQPRGHRAGRRRPGASPSATATARPRPPRRSATPRPAGQARLDGPAAARVPVALRRPGTGEAGRRGRDLRRPRRRGRSA